MPLRLVGDDSSPRTLGPAPLLSAPRRESLLLREDGQASPKKKFKDCPIGYLHVDFAEVLIEEDRQYLFVASDRTSKVAFAELHPRAKRVVAAEFLWRVLEKFPYWVHKLLTCSGVQFTPQPRQHLPGGHIFDRVCRAFGVEHRLTKPAHPWTNGQVERFNRTLKEATGQRYHYQTTAELNQYLQAFLLAYNHAKRLKTLRGLTRPSVDTGQAMTEPSAARAVRCTSPSIRSGTCWRQWGRQPTSKTAPSWAPSLKKYKQ